MAGDTFVQFCFYLLPRTNHQHRYLMTLLVLNEKWYMLRGFLLTSLRQWVGLQSEGWRMWPGEVHKELQRGVQMVGSKPLNPHSS